MVFFYYIFFGVLMNRFQTFSVDEIFNYMDARKPLIYEGHRISLTSQRLVLFHDSGVECVECGLQGNIFVLESHKEEKPHINLYHMDSDARMILFTKDHIYPKSLGGKNIMSNYQTMCTLCNGRKSNKVL